MTDANLTPFDKPKSLKRSQRVLTSLVSGASLQEIGAKEKITLKQTEKILRDELRARWVAPSHDFAKLQVARLESMIARLVDRIQKGDLPAIDRALKILDRLDRYHGFARASGAPEPFGEEERERLINKISELAARSRADEPGE